MARLLNLDEWLDALPTDPSLVDGWLDAGRILYPDDGALADTLKEGARQLLYRDLEQSAHLARALIHHGKRQESLTILALGEMALADALRLQHRFDEAYRLFDRAASRFLAAGDELGWARTRIGWLGHIHYRPDAPQIESQIDRAAAILRRHKRWPLLAAFCANAARYYIYLSRPEPQLAWAQRGREAARRIPPGQGRFLALSYILAMMVEIYTDQGQYEEAERTSAELLPLFEGREGTTELHVVALTAVGRLYFETGRYSQALYHFYQAQEQAQSQEQRLIVTLLLADTYRRLNRLDRTEALLKEMLDSIDGNQDWALMEYEGRLLLSEVLGSQQEWRTALEVLEPALRQMDGRSDGSPVWLSRAYQQQARALLELDEREALPEMVLHAIDLARGIGVDAIIAEAHMLEAQVAAEPQARTRALERALEATEQIPWMRWRVFRLQAHLSEGAAHHEALTRAADDLDAVQGAIVASFHADFLAEAESLYQELIASHLARGEIEEAWGAVERSKSRALMNLIAYNQEQPRPATSPRLAEIARLQGQYHAALQARLQGKNSAEDVRRIEREILRVHEAIEVEIMGRREPLDAPRPILPVAPSGSDLLGFYLVDEQVHLFLHDGRHTHHRRLAVQPEELAVLATALWINMETVPGAPEWFGESLISQADALLEQAYERLIAPVETLFRNDRLVVVPHGLLHQLPFHLFRNAQGYLLESREVRVVPTARLLDRPPRAGRPPAGKQVIFCHDWDQQLPRVRDEAALIAQTLGEVELYAGPEATWEALSRALREATVLHIAAHGEHRPEAPQFSHIQLDDARFCLTDLFYHSTRASLVTLSACETGQTVIRAGDDPVGLWRGFLAAGARSLLVALWKLEDDATLELMRHYYQRLAAGQAKLAALRAVQLEWLAGATGARRHPFFWGALQLIGDDGPLTD